MSGVSGSSARPAPTLTPVLPAGLADRVLALEEVYRRIATTRMAGLGLCHPGLAVAAVGFEPEPAGGAAGVLVTPWFMNLVWLPDDGVPAATPAAASAATENPPPPALPLGESRARAVGQETVDFLGAFEPGLGAFETCSLFSPMFEFVDQAAALATAEAALRLLREPPAAQVQGQVQEQAQPLLPPQPPRQAQAPTPVAARATEPLPARRAFLLGRRAA